MATQEPIEEMTARLKTELNSDESTMKYYTNSCSIDDVHYNILKGRMEIAMLDFIDFQLQTDDQDEIKSYLDETTSLLLKAVFND